MIQFIKKLFKKESSIDDLIRSNGITEEQLRSIGDASFLIEVEESDKSKIERINEIKGLNIKTGPSHSLGLAVLSVSADAFTVLIGLTSLAKWLGKKYFVTINCGEGKQKVTIADAIKHYLSQASGKELKS